MHAGDLDVPGVVEADDADDGVEGVFVRHGVRERVERRRRGSEGYARRLEW